MAAETLSLQEGLETGYYYREMLEDILGLEQNVKSEAFVDNRSVIEAILFTRLVENKRLRIDIAAIKESVQLLEVNRIKGVPGHLQLASSMTKQGGILNEFWANNIFYYVTIKSVNFIVQSRVSSKHHYLCFTYINFQVPFLTVFCKEFS